MARKWYVLDLLGRARDHYDAPDSRLAGDAGQAWRTFFASGATWMAQALTLLRNQSPPLRPCLCLALSHPSRVRHPSCPRQDGFYVPLTDVQDAIYK